MSDYTDAPVVPTPAPEPPYYAVVFTSTRTDLDPDGYTGTAGHLSDLVRHIPGFLGEDFAHTPGGLAISVAYFRDLAGIEEWRRHPEHLDAKRRGRERWYERYVIHIARVEHSHGFTRV
ncbi:antibiotic biosynthesis monooxygenase family protein [Streptomyces diastatochromogenes]|uniref:Antibiotic biosynthesis monooxygenase n=1 Tax=Streptomyces diastatochromogenes TaxID=42236 RepID=A0A233SC57_STRDA|nr:antibiotic biosynthesis monooxygenase [Streptomyces diastatochromogenes]MCZ0988232.1 antibiotic biosynthesis monooxygenase [Streptomyces diastatochromogenes]OXY93221.1 antibiotic biosynthesis monooxygenase [Streptomyces diastatochromogenes]